MSHRVIDLGAYPVTSRPHNREKTPVFDPKDLWSYESRMAIQVIRTDEDQKRGQVVTIVRHVFTAEMHASGIDYDKVRHFMLHETDPMLDAIVSTKGIRTSGKPMVYGRMTVHGSGKKGRKSAGTWFKGVIGDPLAKMQAHGFYDKETQTRFRAIVYWADEEIEAILVPMDSDIHTLADLGIGLSHDPKAPKRLKRATAPHTLMLQFTVVKTEQTPDGVLYTLTHAMLDRDVTVLSFDMSTLSPYLVRAVDGMNIVNLFARLFGREFAHLKFTGLLSEGLAKGYGHATALVDPDVVLFGTKGELRLNDDGTAYLGVLGLLHAGDAKMDVQTGINMGFFDPELAPAEGRFWMNEIRDIRFSEDEAKIRDLDAIFARISDQQSEKDAAEKGSLYFSSPEDEYTAVRAAKLMIENQSMPVLWRRSMLRALEHAVDITRGRILMRRVMRRLDLSPNLLAFQRTGRPDQSLDQLTHEHFPQVPKHMHIVCCWDMDEGSMHLVRNPNTSSREAILVWNVHLTGLVGYVGQGIVFFSFAACELLVRLNGADFDDSVLATTDPRYIAKWLTMDYPVTEKLSVTESTQRPRWTAWTLVTGDADLMRWTSSSDGIGGVVNNIMLDTLLSGPNRLHAIEKTEAGLYTVPDNFSGGDPAAFVAQVVLPYLKTFKKDYVNAFEANNSEYAIDWLSMRKGDERVARSIIDGVKRIMKYQDGTGAVRPLPCFPKTWDMEGKCRIPAERKKQGDYILVETEVCESLAALAALRDEILEAARQKEWTLVRPLPTDVDYRYPSDGFTKPAVVDLRKTWRRLIEDLKARHGGVFPKGGYQLIANGADVKEEIAPTDPDYDQQKALASLVEGRAVEQQFRAIRIEGLKEHYFYMNGRDDKTIPVPLHHRIGMAVEWLRQVYDVNTLEPRKNPEGITQSFGDGVPEYILHDYMTACEVCKLTGLVVYVKLDPRAKRRLTQPIRVKVVTGQINTWVIDRENGLKIGTISKLITVPDGDYMMSAQGVVVVTESDPSLHSTFKVDQLAMRAAGIVDEVDADFEDDDDPYAS